MNSEQGTCVYKLNKTPSVPWGWKLSRAWKVTERFQKEDDMVGWHHRLNGCEFEQTLGDGEGQGSLVCCGLWGSKELDTTQ